MFDALSDRFDGIFKRLRGKGRLTAADVEELAADMGLTVRVLRQDGQDLPATADLRTDRVNVAVEAGIVTEVISVG